MQNSENTKRSAEIMFRLIRELWYESDYCKKVMKNVAHSIFEVNKSGGKELEAVRCFMFLIDNGYIKEVSKEQHLYEFTETGKSIKTQKDVENIIDQVPDSDLIK